jgi:hypothetical protein
LFPFKIKIPAILAFIAPYLSVASGAIAAWLLVHVHILGIFHVGRAGVQQAIYGAVVFGITSILTYLAAHFHWLPLVTAKHTGTGDARSLTALPGGATGTGGAQDAATIAGGKRTR